MQKAELDLIALALSPIKRLTDPSEQGYWLTYIGALIIAAILYVGMRMNRKLSLKGLIRFIFPVKLWLHKSTRADIKLYFFSALYLSVQAVVIVTPFVPVSSFVTSVLTSVFGEPSRTGAPSAFLASLGAVFVFLCLELGYWFAHFLMHRVPWLWEFHKVHHSAEVMTPLTEWRQHPVELALSSLSLGTFAAFGHAVISFWLGSDYPLAGGLTTGFILFVYMMTFLHLRHSHVPVTLPAPLGAIFQSPRHHQIHHSTDPAHFDKNFGLALSLWDTVFGTLCISDTKTKLRFGVIDDKGTLDALSQSPRLVDHLFLPFIRVTKPLNEAPSNQPETKSPV